MEVPLPSGKQPHNYGKIHHAINGKIHYFDWAICHLPGAGLGGEDGAKVQELQLLPRNTTQKPRVKDRVDDLEGWMHFLVKTYGKDWKILEDHQSKKGDGSLDGT